MPLSETATYDPRLALGARNAVRACLRIRPDEKVTLITDAASQEISAAIAHQLRRLGAPHRAWTLEECAERPLKEMPKAVLEDLETSQVSIFAVVAQQNELPSRMQMTEVVNRRKIRHAHMVNITKQIMLDGMRANYSEVDALSLRVLGITSQAREIRAQTDAGTDIIATMNPDVQVAQDQRHHQRQHVGQSSGRRGVDDARRSERDVRR